MNHSTLPQNIFFIGPGGVGKSTVGKIVSKKIQYDFIDLDEEFCAIVDNIGKYIQAHGYSSYCHKNSRLFYYLLKKQEGIPTIFALSSGFLVHKNEKVLTDTHKKTLKACGLCILLLPDRSKEVSVEIVIKRQMLRGFNLEENNERNKFLDRFEKYQKYGDLHIYSHKDPKDIAKEIKIKLDEYHH